MTNAPSLSPRAAWILILVASAIMMITMGARLTTALLFVAALGATRLATVPQTAGLAGNLFGAKA